MTILVLGGKGKTSSELAKLLDAKRIPFILASRSPSNDSSSQYVRFDWLDDSTYDIPFEAATEPITAIYLVAPEVSDPFPPMKEFIDHARRKGTKRFVLLSATVIPKGGPVYGKVHEYLETLGVEYGVLRPSWFMGMLNSHNFFNFLALLTIIDREFH
jgi:festuclavine dehydrogenase